jgi:hypothetical protein
MVFALLLIASLADWVPMRWKSAEPASLDLLQGTPVNSIVLERAQWSPPLLEAARARSIATAGVLRPTDPPEAAKQAAALPFDAIILEGDFAQKPSLDTKATVIELPSRARMRFEGTPVAGTIEAVWPGIQAEEGGSAKAAPTGGPWVNTNAGFIRFARAAAAPEMPVWIANQPPPNTVITGERYLQAIADAAFVGARWVLAFEDDWMKRFYARESSAMKDWKRIVEQLAYFESHREWKGMQPLSQLAIVQDVDSGALFSGGVLDMIAVKHTPVRTIPARKLSADAMSGSKMAVNVDPSALTDAQKETMRAFARGGGTTLSGPAAWKFPVVKPGQITLTDSEVKTLDEIWREVNSMTGRRNLGARLFNVSSMLSNLLQSTDGKTAVLHLINYSGYPVENVTVHLLGKFKTATLIAPGAQPRKLEPYVIEEGTGIDVDSVAVMATLVIE